MSNCESDWVNSIQIENLPENLRDIAELIGMENMLLILDHFSKQLIYIPGKDQIIKNAKRKFIQNNFTGINHRDLCRKTGYSLSYVYKILKDSHDNR
ncbi:MAG: hypothetical protein HQK92_16575 [Nitrospirae bacterium]|nr:hypothetical protein [Nitrospirota bacterium]